MIYYFIAAFLFLSIPFFTGRWVSTPVNWTIWKVRNFIAMPNTLIHELAHLLMAYVTGGKGYSIKLNPDLSGVAVTSSRYRLGEILMVMSGYTGASIASYAMLDFYMKDQILSLLVFMLIMFAITAIFIRNLYGFLWILSVAFIVYSFSPFSDWSTWDLTPYANQILLFIIAVCSIESWLSSYRVMMDAFKKPSEKSDATDLKDLTKIPSFIWGLFFFTVSTVVLYLQIMLVL